MAATTVDPKLGASAVKVLKLVAQGPADSTEQLYARNGGERVNNVKRVLEGLRDKGLINYRAAPKFRVSCTSKGRSLARRV